MGIGGVLAVLGIMRPATPLEFEFPAPEDFGDQPDLQSPRRYSGRIRRSLWAGRTSRPFQHPGPHQWGSTPAEIMNKGRWPRWVAQAAPAPAGVLLDAIRKRFALSNAAAEKSGAANPHVTQNRRAPGSRVATLEDSHGRGLISVRREPQRSECIRPLRRALPHTNDLGAERVPKPRGAEPRSVITRRSCRAGASGEPL